MLILGLTGSIATGKSTVSNILRSPPYSLPIIDADVLSRQVVEPGTPGYAAIISHFGPSTPDLLQSVSECGAEDGPKGKGRPLNRPALGKRIFGSGAEKETDRKVLGGIVHPAVRREMWKAMARAYILGNWAVVLDIPLLYESGWEKLCGTIMVVAVRNPEVQRQRLMERDEHLSEEDARNRVESQMDVRDKAVRAKRRGEGSGVVVWNDGGKEELRREVERVMSVVRRGSPGWWGWLLLFVPPLAGAAGLLSFLRNWLVQKRWAREKEREKSKL